MNGLRISKKMEQNTLVIFLNGKVTAANAEMIMSAVKKDMKLFKNVRIDASKLAYISSAGLRQIHMIMAVTKNKGGKTSITNMNDEVHEILDMTGFLELLEGQ